MQFIIRKWKRIAAAILLVALMLSLALPIAQAQDSSTFISIRLYEGIDPADQAEIGRIADEGFLPLLREAPGFIGYYLVHTDGEGLAAVNLFETQEQAQASNELARDYVAENLAPLLPNPPQIVEGQIDVSFVKLLADMDMEDEEADMDTEGEESDMDMEDEEADMDMMADDDISALFASIRIYEGFDMENLDGMVALVQDIFLPLMQETPGFFGYHTMHSGEGVVAAISIFVSEEAALASNEMARDFVAENLAELLPNDPLITSGNLSVASLMAWHDGENLVEGLMHADMDDESEG